MVQATRKKRKWPRIVAAILALILLIAGTGLVLLDRFWPEQTFLPETIVQMPEEVVSVVIKPFQTAFTWISGHVSSYLRSWKMRKTLEIEYNRIKQENDRLIFEALFNETLEAENEQLRKQLGEFERQSSMNPILAQVTAKESGNWYSIFTINKGEAHGLKPDMAVINADGLIGRVYEVEKYSAQVISIVDSRSSIGGLIESSRDQGIIKGTLGVEAEATCRMYYLPVNTVPRPGDTVVTSGVGLPFPKGLKIGVVRESTRHMDENKHYIVVEPFVDFMHIEEVLVLIYLATPEDMTAADDGQLNYVPTPLDTPRPVPVIGEEELESVYATASPIPRPSWGPLETPGPGEVVWDPEDLGYLDPFEEGPEDEPEDDVSDSGLEPDAEGE